MSRRFTLRLALLAVSASVLALAPALAEGAFKGRNGKIAFESDRDGDGDIYITDAKGKRTRNLTKNTGIDDSDPRWSPNGKQIVFERTYEGETDAEVAVLTVRSGNVKRLTTNDFEEGDPSYSPDGKRIAFISDSGGDQDIYTMRAKNGAGVAPVTDNDTDDWDPAWAPNGKRIAYTHSDPMEEGMDLEVATIKPDGTGFRKLTDNTNMIGDNEPEWSPDSKRITFESDRPLDPMGMLDDEVWIMKADGSGKKRLTERAETFEGDASFSPDGRWITFESNADSNGDVYRMHTDGTHIRRITRNAGYDAEPDWQALPRKRRR